MFAVENFKLEGRVSEYALDADNGNRVTKAFCPKCGSQVLGRNSGSADYVTVSLGTLDDSSELEPQVAIFARNRKPWDIMDHPTPDF